MKSKQMISGLLVFLLVGSLLVIAQSEFVDPFADVEEECDFWCKVKGFLFGRERAVVGEVTLPPETYVGILQPGDVLRINGEDRTVVRVEPSPTVIGDVRVIFRETSIALVREPNSPISDISGFRSAGRPSAPAPPPATPSGGETPAAPGAPAASAPPAASTPTNPQAGDYFVSTNSRGENAIVAFDGTNWARLNQNGQPLAMPKDSNGDPMSQAVFNAQMNSAYPQWRQTGRIAQTGGRVQYGQDARFAQRRTAASTAGAPAAPAAATTINPRANYLLGDDDKFYLEGTQPPSGVTLSSRPTTGQQIISAQRQGDVVTAAPAPTQPRQAPSQFADSYEFNWGGTPPADAKPGETPASRPGQPEMTNIGGLQIPKDEADEIFNWGADGKPTGLAQGYAYDPQTKALTHNGQPLTYDKGLKREGDNVQLWTGSGYSASLSSDTYGKYGSAIDPTSISGNTFDLKDGGSLTEIVDAKTGATILSVTTKPEEGKSKTETTVTLANGQKVTLDVPITSLDGLAGKRARFNGEDAEVYMSNNALVVETEDEAVATERLEDGRIQTTTLDLDDGDETIERRNMQTNEVETLEYEDDELDSWAVRDKKGNVIGRAEINDGKVEEFRGYDENGDLRSVTFYEDGDPDKPQRVINIISEDKVSVTVNGVTTTYTEDEIEEMLKKNPDDPFAKQLAAAQNAGENDAFWSFNPQRSSFWNIATGREFAVQQAIGSVMTIRPGWHGISNLFAPDMTADMRAWADEKFASAMLLDQATVALSEVCSEEASVPGSNARFIRTRSGTYQFVGSIQAEKTTQKVPILCVPNPDEEAEEDELWICPTEEYVCRDDFCYEDEDDQNPVEGHYYKITWGVTAPQDESFTPYIDENGVAVKFNLKFTGTDFWLYKSESGFGDINSILLTNGESDGGTIVHYSPQNFDEVCILFGAPPEDWLGDAVNKICTSVETVSEKVAEESSSSERGSRTTSSGQVQLNSNW